MRGTTPDVVFVEQEPFSVAGFQWARAAWRSAIPFGLQADENLDRPMPGVAVKMRGWTLRRAAFVAACSAAAASLVRRWGAVGRVEVVAHPVPGWACRQAGDGIFTVGYAGRLVEEKGIGDLVEAVRMMSQPARLLAVGNGPLLSQVRSFRGRGCGLRVRTSGWPTHTAAWTYWSCRRGGPRSGRSSSAGRSSRPCSAECR